MGSSWTRVWVPVGAVLFVMALIGSALVVPQLRLLHFLQGLIYVAIVILARRNSVWGLGAGVTIAVVWNGLNLFLTHLVQAGMIVFWHFLHTGEVRRPDTMMVPLGAIGHFVLIIACLAAFLDRKTDNHKWWRFLGGGLATLAYFALIIVIARPR